MPEKTSTHSSARTRFAGSAEARSGERRVAPVVAVGTPEDLPRALEHPAVVSGRLDLPLDLPLLQAPEQRVVVITASDAELEDCPAEVHYIRAPDGSLMPC